MNEPKPGQWTPGLPPDDANNLYRLRASSLEGLDEHGTAVSVYRGDHAQHFTGTVAHCLVGPVPPPYAPPAPAPKKALPRHEAHRFWYVNNWCGSVFESVTTMPAVNALISASRANLDAMGFDTTNLENDGSEKLVPASELTSLRETNKKLIAEAQERDRGDAVIAEIARISAPVKDGKTPGDVARIAWQDSAARAGESLCARSDRAWPAAAAAVLAAFGQGDEVKQLRDDLSERCRQVGEMQPELGKLRSELAVVTKDRDEARRAIESYGNNPAGFDWAILGKIDELERERDELRVQLAKLEAPAKSVADGQMYEGASHGAVGEAAKGWRPATAADIGRKCRVRDYESSDWQYPADVALSQIREVYPFCVGCLWKFCEVFDP